MENFNPRPGQPLLSDLFNQTTSGAPVIIYLISNPQSFNLLSLTEKKQFISNLTYIVGQVKNGTKWTHRGTLNIYPTTNNQKKQLLELKAVKDVQIKCTPAMSETFVRGVIRNVPTGDAEEALLALLSDQAVTKDLASLITVRTGPYRESDHLPVMIDLDLNTSTNSAPNDHWTFHKDNWTKGNEDISQKLTQANYPMLINPEEVYHLFYKAIIEASERHHRPKKNYKESNKPWWTAE
ncbi:Uncharacterized protein APZ42_025137 [Daphnia magna]|uniref:Endonuclease/exonuclease/phosphatase domain-containing protein n=1 Tax=Daphnia magna TaxID=35525 RepID=A0A164TFJ0_9CRUS|nr:Uncharacterized protein APZ42_025137 [Daphnia magna]